MTDQRGLWGHHPDCPMSRHGDSVLVRTHMHPCNFCDVADKAEQRGREAVAQMWDADKDTFPGRIIESFDRGVAEEKRRIRAEVVDYYRVAPKAAESILRIIDGSET